MDDKKLLFELEIKGTKEELEALAKVNENISKLKGEIKELNKTDKERAEQKKLTLKFEQQQYRELLKQVENEVKAARLSINTIEGKRAQLAKLNAEWKKTEIGSEQFNKLEKEIGEATAELKKFEGATGNFTRNVGNYKEAADIATLSVNEMRREIRALRDEPVAGKSQEEINQLNTRIGVLTDAMQKLRMEQVSKGMDAMQAFAGSMQAVSASAQVLAGGLNVLGIESEAFAKLQKNVVSLIAVSHGLKTIEDVLNKQTIQRTASLISLQVEKVKTTFATNRLAASTAMQAKAQTASTAATKLGYTAMARLNAIMAANPIMFIVGGLALLTAGIYAATRVLGVKNKELERERKLNAEINSQYAEQASEVIYLTKQIENNNLSLKQRQEAIEKMKAIMPEYNGELDKEGRLINHNTNEIAAYLVQLKEKIRLQTIDNQIRAAITEQQTAELRVEQIRAEVGGNWRNITRAQIKELERLDKTLQDNKKTQAFLTKEMERNAEAADKTPPIITKTTKTIASLRAEVSQLQTDYENAAIGSDAQTTALTKLIEKQKELDALTTKKTTGTTTTPKTKPEEKPAAEPDLLKLRLDKLQQLQTLDSKEMELAGATANELLKLQADYLGMRMTALEGAGLQETFAYQEMEVEKLLIEKQITDSAKKEHEERLQILELAKQKEKEMQDVWALADAVDSEERFAIEKQQMQQRHNERLAALEIQETDSEEVRQAKRIERELAEEEHKRRMLAAEKKYKQEVEAVDKELAMAKIAAAQSVLGAMGSIFSQGAQQNKLLFGLEKATALGQAVLNLKQGLAKTSANAPYPFNIPLIAGFIGQTAGIIGSMVAVKSPQVPKFAKGVIGLEGAGTSTSDSIDAKLSKGESVITAKATKAFAPELAAMEMAVGNKPNFDKGVKRFARGVVGVKPKSVFQDIRERINVLRFRKEIENYLKQVTIQEIKEVEKKLKVVETSVNVAETTNISNAIRRVINTETTNVNRIRNVSERTPTRVNGIQLADEVLRVLKSQRVYVVESDITDTQNVVRKIKVIGDL